MNVLEKWLYSPIFKIVFLQKQQNAYFVHSTLKTKNLKSIIKASKERQFVIDIDKPTYITKNIRVYFVDYEKNSQFTMSEITRAMSPQELDMIVGTKIIRELTAGVIDNNKIKIFWALMGAVVGVLLGLVIMQVIMTNKIEEILLGQLETTEVVPFNPMGAITWLF